jgi:hypothetical protein
MDGYSRFLQQQADALKDISKFTKGEHRYEDVCQEAWLFAREFADRSGSPPDFLDPDFQAQVLLHLRRKLINGDRRFRYATRLDHAVHGEADPGAAHPLMDRLVSDEGRDPLSHLLSSAERICEPPDEASLPLSLALAWALLLRAHDNRMRTVAGRLLISVAHAYHCCAKARRAIARQHVLPLEAPPDHPARRLGPWRRYRRESVPRQLAFDFEDRLPFPDASAPNPH